MQLHWHISPLPRLRPKRKRHKMICRDAIMGRSRSLSCIRSFKICIATSRVYPSNRDILKPTHQFTPAWFALSGNHSLGLSSGVRHIYTNGSSSLGPVLFHSTSPEFAPALTTQHHSSLVVPSAVGMAVSTFLYPKGLRSSDSQLSPSIFVSIKISCILATTSQAVDMYWSCSIAVTLPSVLLFSWVLFVSLELANVLFRVFISPQLVSWPPAKDLKL